MMIGVAFSRGAFSMRMTPSIGVTMSSSAGSDIVIHLLDGRTFGWALGVGLDGTEKRCERRDLVGRAFDADHRWPFGGHGGTQGGGEFGWFRDVDRRKPGEHRGKPRAEAARGEP